MLTIPRPFLTGIGKATDEQIVFAKRESSLQLCCIFVLFLLAGLLALKRSLVPNQRFKGEREWPLELVSGGKTSTFNFEPCNILHPQMAQSVLEILAYRRGDLF